MRFDLITIFPHIFDSYLGESLLKRAQKKGLIKIAVHNLRDFTTDKHKKVDDTPYGGGPGMVLKIEPIYEAVRHVLIVGNVLAESKKRAERSNKRSDLTATTTRTVRTRIILFSTRGKKFDAKTARRLSKYDQLILICGRYEGVDERVAEHIADEEISIGDFVLSGGELPAMILIEAVARHIPGVLGKRESLEEIKGSYPAYTKPEVFSLVTSDKRQVTRKKKWKVPKILLSGNHAEIQKWRDGHSRSG